MKILSLRDLISKSKPSKTQEKIEKARQDSRHGIHFICQKLHMNVDQYWCDEVCKNCKNEK